VQINTQCFIPDKTGRISKLSKPMLNFRGGVQSKFEGFAYCFHATNIAYIFNRSMYMNNEIRKGKKRVYNLHVHLVFVTKYRRCVFTKAVLEFNGENDPMYICLSLTRPNFLSLNWPTV
jgi:hypothetical protein